MQINVLRSMSRRGNPVLYQIAAKARKPLPSNIAITKQLSRRPQRIRLLTGGTIDHCSTDLAATFFYSNATPD
jgi:hypothetical protein